MNKFLLLLKVQLAGSLGLNRMRYTKDKKEKNRLMAMNALMLFLGLILIIYSTATAFSIVTFGMVSLLPPLIIMICATSTLVITFLKSNGILFGFSDYDMVMSLPVNSTTIILSRLASIYVVNLLISGIVMLPSILIYGILQHVTIGVWIMLILSMFIATLLPMIFAMITGAIITAISMRFKHKNLIVTVLNIGLIVGFFLLTSSFNMQIDTTKILEMITLFIEGFYKIYPLARWFNDAISNNDWLSYSFFVLASMGITGVFVSVLSVFYTKINSALFSVQSKNNYRLGKLKTTTPLMAAYRNELQRFISIPLYTVNTAIGGVLLIFASITTLFINIEQMEQLIGISGLLYWIKLFIPWIIAIFAAISSSTAASVSIEGKNSWIMASLPVETKVIWNAKIMVNLTYMLPAVLISSICFTISLKLNLMESIMMFSVASLYTIFIAVIGLALNVNFPNYNWMNPQQVIKQSLPILLTMLIGFVSVMSFVAITFLLQSVSSLALGICAILMVVILVILYRNLANKKLYVY